MQPHELCLQHRSTRYTFPDLRDLLAKATPLRMRPLAGIAAESAAQRVAAQYALADLPLAHFLSEQVVPYESDESRASSPTPRRPSLRARRSLTVGELRNWLLSDEPHRRLATLAPPHRRWPPP